MQRGMASGIVPGLVLVCVLMASWWREGAVRVQAAAQISTQGQQPGAGQSPPPNHAPGVGEPDETDPAQVKVHQQMVLRENDERHKRLEADADRLLALSTELKADVDKTSKDELSLQVIRKAAEIEKLAHDVRQRMQQ